MQCAKRSSAQQQFHIWKPLRFSKFFAFIFRISCRRANILLTYLVNKRKYSLFSECREWENLRDDLVVWISSSILLKSPALLTHTLYYAIVWLPDSKYPPAAGKFSLKNNGGRAFIFVEGNILKFLCFSPSDFFEKGLPATIWVWASVLILPLGFSFDFSYQYQMYWESSLQFGMSKVSRLQGRGNTKIAELLVLLSTKDG